MERVKKGHCKELSNRSTLTGKGSMFRLALAAMVILAIGGAPAYADNRGGKEKSAVFMAEGFDIFNPSNYTVFVSLTLPAGKYLIVGKGVVLNQQDTSGTAACNMMSGSTNLDTSDASLPAAAIIGTGSYATLAFNAVLDLHASGDVRIECISTGPAMPGSFSLSALTVGDLILQ